MLADLPESVLFLIFLLFFLVAGIYPVWQKAAPKIREFFKQQSESAGHSSVRFPGTQTPTFERAQLSQNLTDYDLFVFRALAQAGKKGLSRKQIATQLHLEPMMIRAALGALNRRHLVRMSIKYSILVRFHLSPQGYELALEQGVVPRILKREGG